MARKKYTEYKPKINYRWGFWRRQQHESHQLKFVWHLVVLDGVILYSNRLYWAFVCAFACVCLLRGVITLNGDIKPWQIYAYGVCVCVLRACVRSNARAFLFVCLLHT